MRRLIKWLKNRLFFLQPSCLLADNGGLRLFKNFYNTILPYLSSDVVRILSNFIRNLSDFVRESSIFKNPLVLDHIYANLLYHLIMVAHDIRKHQQIRYKQSEAFHSIWYG